MSGRLVILRHKSWNVWNRDNQEKVLRDERLHREEIEEKKQSNKRKLSETTYTELSSSHPTSHISKLKNYETPNTKDPTISETFIKKSSQHLIPDWKLGDGSKELAKSTPWYENPRATMIEDKKILTEQETKKKRHLDPLSQFYNESGRIESKEEKEEKEDNQFRGRKNNKTKIDTLNNSNEPIASPQASTESSDSKQLLHLQLLREKRLKREKSERKRELMLLAHVDAYGR